MAAMPRASCILGLSLVFSVLISLHEGRSDHKPSYGQCLLQKSKKCEYANSQQKLAPVDPAERQDPVPPKGAACANSVVAWWVRNLLGMDPCQKIAQSWLAVPDFVEIPERAPSERDLYFRPVSVTLYCVMWLTIQSILVHSCVAVARTSDDLSARLEPSFPTQVLETMARSVPLAPPMSMLFVANRIYMLESTSGLGEVEPWVKLCMITASFGMTWQLLTVVMLAVTADKSEHRFSELGGDARDAHPHILRYPFCSAYSRAVNLAMQAVSMLCIYGGVGGVAVGMAISGRGTDADSAAVCCTAALIALYFAVQLALWATNTGLLEGKMSKYEKAVRTCAVKADHVAQKAPMYAILLLSTRLRQVQEGKPGGTPPQGLVACFAILVTALYLEVFLCPWSRAGLDHEDDTSPLDLTTRILTYVQGVIAIGGFSCGCVVANSIVTPWVKTPALPMSPTIYSVLMLCLTFFLVHLLLTLYALARSFLKLTSWRAQDALLSARNSVGFCPLLCTLFLGARMRALQITNNQGMPPWWEQDFLFLCIGATVIEVVCCMTVPFFYKEVGVDSAGNPTYDVQSLTGTYVVMMVRYIGLLGLHGGIAGVCMAVIVMTPQSAVGTRPDDAESWRSLARAMLWTLLGIMLASLMSSAKVVGLMVKLALESIDELLLNAEITVETAVLSVFRGLVIIKGLVVKNPNGGKFKSEYLFKADIAAVNIRLWRLVKSLAKDIEITEVVLNGVQLNYELGSDGGNSNVASLVEYIEGEQKEEKAPEPPPKKESSTFLESLRSKSQASLGKEKEPAPTPSASAINLVIQRILVKNVAARVLHPSLGPLAVVDLGELDIPDASKLASGKGVGGIVIFVLKTVLKTAMSNAEVMRSLLVQGTSHVVSTVASGVKSCGPCVPFRSCLRGSSSSTTREPPAQPMPPK
uniref:Uncharacterized protein n=1 Tax=Pyrodinium bahamense TaxID=73915 RepID=A0A7S0A5K4_9DINO|mmetsp:Transcript_22784/g.63397  ORF Transcript_22784/g.63397 Transcript_22784/m.63397 type:complete len:925 (+) Transcript_22784:132-2906(+)